MTGLLFDPTEYTDERIRAVMEGKTCRTCGNRLRHEYSKSTYYCAAIRKSLDTAILHGKMKTQIERMIG